MPIAYRSDWFCQFYHIRSGLHKSFYITKSHLKQIRGAIWGSGLSSMHVSLVALIFTDVIVSKHGISKSHCVRLLKFISRNSEAADH